MDSSSNYSSCSDHRQENASQSGRNIDLQETGQSIILAGNIPLQNSTVSLDDSVSSEEDETVGILDRTIDLGSDEDQFVDCKGSSFELSSAKCSENNSSESNFERLMTILEETEITHATYHKISNLSNNVSSHSRKPMDSKIEKKVQILEPINNLMGKLTLKDQEKFNKKMDVNFNIHSNDTNSFMIWENRCETVNSLTSIRKSWSCSNLSSTNMLYEADNESSVTTETSSSCNKAFFDASSGRNNSKKVCTRKSKSCSSLLKEVKHLPHLLYDTFLKCLSEEINHIRKEHIVCKCPEPLKEKHLQKISSQNAVKKISPMKMGKENKPPIAKHHFTKPPMESKIKNIRYLKPSSEKSLKVSPSQTQKLNKVSPRLSKTHLTPTRIYSWHKEIVSPVKEYIEGKRAVIRNKPVPLKERL